MSYPTIRKGSRVPEVKIWQQVIGVTADGIFGPATEAATKKWQAQKGLVADGIVGPKTWAAAFPTGPTFAPPTPTPAFTPSVTASPSFVQTSAPAAPTSFPTLRKGSRLPEVKVWQAIIGVTADGIFGPATETATKKWQSQRGLVADGIVGPKTWAVAFPAAAPKLTAQPSFVPLPVMTAPAIFSPPVPAQPTFAPVKPPSFQPAPVPAPPKPVQTTAAKLTAPVKATALKVNNLLQKAVPTSLVSTTVVEETAEKKSDFLNWVILLGGGAAIGTLAFFGIRKLR